MFCDAPPPGEAAWSGLGLPHPSPLGLALEPDPFLRECRRLWVAQSLPVRRRSHFSPSAALKWGFQPSQTPSACSLCDLPGVPLP